MEPQTLFLYMSVVLNLLLSTLLALQYRPPSPITLAEHSRCCPCPKASASALTASEQTTTSPPKTENALVAIKGAQVPPTSKPKPIDGGEDPTFGGTGKTYDQDVVDAVVAVPTNASFDFLNKPCSQRLTKPGLYFVDLGANCGNSYELFLRRILPTLNFPSASKALRAFLFEFNPRMHREFLDPLVKRDSRVRVMKAAAHVKDGTFTAYLDKRKEQPGEFKCIAKPGARNPAGASTLVGAMPRAGEAITVQAIDIPRFLRNTFCKGDLVHLKMDIEGFEYPLLEAIIKEKVQCMVTAFYIEFHKNLPKVEFMGHNMTPVEAAGEARRQLRKCSLVREWF